ncbi:MAG TPA: glycerophosphodiester phosphodiesterase [Candidatus Obscuribacterales bacterium]
MNRPIPGERFFRLVRIGRPLVIAHRGASASAPENTIPAFVRGIADGADIVEMDLHLTKDGVPVVCHDATVDRTTNGKGFINALTLGEIKKLDAGYRFTPDGGKTFPFRGQGITIPTLSEALTALPDQSVMIEVKVSSQRMLSELVKVIRQHDCFDRVSIEVFAMKGKMVHRLRRMEPRLLTGHSTAEIIRFLVLSRVGLWRRFRRRGFALEIPPCRRRTTVASKAVIANAWRRGIPVFIWTINDESQMQRFLNMGASGLFTDKPAVLRKLVDSGRWQGFIKRA